MALLAAFLPFVSATSHLVGYSTLPLFLCAGTSRPFCEKVHPSTISRSSFPSLVAHISAPDVDSVPAMPLSRATSSPEVILFVTSRTAIVSPAALLRRLLVAVTPAGEAYTGSSFHAETDHLVSEQDISAISPKFMLPNVERFSSFVADRDINVFDNGVSDVVSLTINNEEDENLWPALHTLATRANSRLAILWTTREDAPASAGSAADSAPAEGAAAGANPATPKEGAEGSDVANSDAHGGAQKNLYRMNPPEITPPQVAGLIVVLVFLLLFIPGFMCLYSIQPPQSFQIFDSNDMKKKMQ